MTAAHNPPPPAVSVIIPCRNEVNHIERLLECVMGQQVPEGGFEVIIADGMSEDGTRQKLDAFAARHGKLRVIDNPRAIVSSGLNLAIQAARGKTIIRMDAHTDYAPDYICQCVRVLENTGADNVGGPWRAAGQTYLQSAIALAFQSRFSSGGAASHAADHEGAVDSVYLGCWSKATLERLGGFDVELVRNQDDELNLRLTRSGGRIWQSPAIRSWYCPRSSISNLFRQYAQYGYWKVRVIQKHKIPASIRHLVPGFFVAGIAVLSLAAPFSPFCRWACFGVIAAYAMACLLASVQACSGPGKLRFLPVMPLVFAAYHFGYGYGFLRGLIDFALLRKGAGRRFVGLTRGSAA